MQGLFDFIRQVIETARPWVMVPPWEQGVRVRLGKHITELAPGIHLVIPLVDVIHTLNVVPQVVNLPNQSVRSRDKKSVAVSGGIEYGIRNIKAAYCNVQDFDRSLQTLAMGIIADYVTAHDFAECTLEEIKAEVLKGIKDACRGWGLDVRRVFITDLCEHKAIRLMTGDTPMTMVSG